MTSIRQSVTDRPSRFRTDSSGVREQRPIDFPVGESVPRHVVSAARGGRQRMCVPLYMVVSLSLWVASPAKLRGSARETREQVNASHLSTSQTRGGAALPGPFGNTPTASFFLPLNHAGQPTARSAIGLLRSPEPTAGLKWQPTARAAIGCLWRPTARSAVGRLPAGSIPALSAPHG